MTARAQFLPRATMNPWPNQLFTNGWHPTWASNFLQSWRRKKASSANEASRIRKFPTAVSNSSWVISSNTQHFEKATKQKFCETSEHNGNLILGASLSVECWLLEFFQTHPTRNEMRVTKSLPKLCCSRVK